MAGCDYSPPGPAVEQAVGLPLDAPRVTLVDAGQGAKRVVAFADIDKEQSASVTVKEGFAQDVVRADAAKNFTTSTLTESATTLPLSIEVSQATADVEGEEPADRNAFFTGGDVAFTPGSGAAPDVSSASGFQFGWRALNSGRVTSLRLAAPQAATDEARAIAEQAIMKLTALPIVFPEDEIGVGARWTVESRVAGDANLLQTTTYVLDSLDGDVAKVSVEVAQRPTLGALTLDGLPTAGGASATAAAGNLEVADTRSTSTGSLTIDVTKPLPVDGHIDVTTAVTYGQPDSPNAVVQTLKTAWEFAPGPAK